MPKFSTSTPTTQIVHKFGLMNAVKQFFSYDMECGCGIKKVKLLGTLMDWKNLKQQTEGLAQYDL